MNHKIIEYVLNCTINEYTMKCRGSNFYYNQFKRNKENFLKETDYDENVPPRKGEFEIRQGKEQEKVEFSEDEYDSVVDYCDEGYITLNDMLWDNEYFHIARNNGYILDSDIEYYEDERKNLNNAIEKAPRLLQDTIMYRGGLLDENLKEGDVSNWKGFTSISYSEDIAKDIFTDNSGDEYLIKIYAPKGTKGLVVNNQFEPIGEHEFILKENQRFQVLSINPSTMEAEVLLLPDNYRRGYD